MPLTVTALDDRRWRGGTGLEGRSGSDRSEDPSRASSEGAPFASASASAAGDSSVLSKKSRRCSKNSTLRALAPSAPDSTHVRIVGASARELRDVERLALGAVEKPQVALQAERDGALADQRETEKHEDVALADVPGERGDGGRTARARGTKRGGGQSVERGRGVGRLGGKGRVGSIDRSIDRTRGSVRRFRGVGRTGGRGGVERRRGEEIGLRAGVQELRVGDEGGEETRVVARARTLTRRGRPTEARGHDGRADATAHLVIHALSHSLARCGRRDDVVHLRRRRRRRSQAGVAPHPARGIPSGDGSPSSYPTDVRWS